MLSIYASGTLVCIQILEYKSLCAVTNSAPVHSQVA